MLRVKEELKVKLEYYEINFAGGTGNIKHIIYVQQARYYSIIGEVFRH